MKTKGNLASLIGALCIVLASLSMTGCATTPLMNAAQRGDVNEIKALLDQGANPNEATSAGSPLSFAIWMAHYEAVKFLLERGADPNINVPSPLFGAGLPKFEPPLVYATGRPGNLKVVNLLIDKGADLEYALKHCQPGVGTTSVAGRYFKQCFDILRSIQAKQPKEKPAKSQDISEEKLAAMLQTAVEKVSKDKKETKTAPAISDIDKPSFNLSEIIMGDNDLAVIIGIEGYQSLPKSDYSYDDAKLVGDYAKAMGFKARNIELLLDERATKSSIEKLIKTWLPNKAKPDSRVFVYYSGHGAPESATGDAYIVPFDGDPNYLSDTGYPLKSLYASLGKLQAAEITVVLDACFSGAGGRSVLAKGARPLVMTTDASVISPNMAVLSATQGAQISSSSPEKGHGIFTYYFLKAIKDGKKNIAEIYEYIKPLVEDEAKGLNVRQSPSVSPDVEKLKGRFGLRK
ncbi:MAG: caspase family protein [Deltaproteobacteria bacterium]|nr:caspase family protein [Deltaproteobacteria bacterium]